VLLFGDIWLKMENALLDLLDVLIVFAIGFRHHKAALPPTYGGVWPSAQRQKNIVD
jgi:hypothetical protein